jgi:hypothetical protein
MYPYSQLYLLRKSKKVEQILKDAVYSSYTIDGWLAISITMANRKSFSESFRDASINYIRLTKELYNLFKETAGDSMRYIEDYGNLDCSKPNTSAISKSEYIYLHTNSEELNKSVGPLYYGDIVTVCKEASCGATRLMCNEVALNLAKHLNGTVNYITTEETVDEIREITKDIDSKCVVPTNALDTDFVLYLLESFKDRIFVIDSVCDVKYVARLKSIAKSNNLLIFVIKQDYDKLVHQYSKATLSIQRGEDECAPLLLKVYHKDSSPDFKECISFDAPSGYFLDKKREDFNQRVFNVLMSISNRTVLQNKETFLKDLLLHFRNDDLERIAGHEITTSEIDDIFIKLQHLWLVDFDKKSTWCEVGEDLQFAPSYKPNGKNRFVLVKATSDLLWKEFNGKEV